EQGFDISHGIGECRGHPQTDTGLAVYPAHVIGWGIGGFGCPVDIAPRGPVVGRNLPLVSEPAGSEPVLVRNAAGINGKSLAFGWRCIADDGCAGGRDIE